jgi:hypothetical protein
MIGKCWLRVGALAALALGMMGCSSSGNEVLKSQTVAAVNSSIIDGQTTRDDIQQIYGQPARVSFLSEKNEMWTYTWTRASAQGQNFIRSSEPLPAPTTLERKNWSSSSTGRTSLSGTP